jgi:hypothetical protein
MRIRIHLFTLMRIRIRLFTLIRVRILINIMQICDHCRSTDFPESILGLHASIASFHGPPRVGSILRVLKLLKFDFNVDPDPAQLVTLMRIRIQLPKIMRIRMLRSVRNRFYLYIYVSSGTLRKAKNRLKKSAAALLTVHRNYLHIF